MTDLEKKRVQAIEIKLEALVKYLDLGGHFGPPTGRADYDAIVKSDLEKAGLQE
jgi:hypothetical protein